MSAAVATATDGAAAGRALGAIGIGAALFTLASTVVPQAPGVDVAGVRVVAGLTLVIALLVHRAVPWHRLPARTTLVLAPVGMALIAAHNSLAGSDPYRYGVFFLALFAWAGAYHPLGTCTALAPLAVVAYVGPLVVLDEPPWALATVAYAVPLYVVVGESLAWRSAALSRAQAELQRIAEHDGLTGLATRAVLMQTLADEVAAGTRVGVVFVDIDDFKAVNDAHGHAAGDALLLRVAAHLRASVRVGDVVGRMAGDEFAVVLRGGPDAHRAVAARLAGHDVPGAPGGRPGCGLSVGLALGRPGESALALVARADQAMYEAKRSGKGRLRVAS